MLGRTLGRASGERGMALPIALATLAVPAITASTVLTFRRQQRGRHGQLVRQRDPRLQNFAGDDFGTIVAVPPGMPGNPEVYAQRNAPQRFSG